ncbi:MAG: methyltransferase domain-containing protein [Kiritimatiellae bacterium]|nr:methyltransferase domain-containing protein [Kiritimatiellia bacterium]MDD5521318.1 methyltransferase domain-containing protein [Kiritimatiellia bacterium]
MIKVNLGSGFVGLDGWLNYDNSIVARLSKYPIIIRLLVNIGLLPSGYLNIKWPPIILHDCRKGIPLEDNSVDYIYTSHFLEHLYRHEVFALLKECHRVLKTSGLIRIVLPDLDRIIDAYVKSNIRAFSEIFPDDVVAPTYADMFVSNFFPYEMNTGKRPLLTEKLKEHFLRRHKWMYNKESFGKILAYQHFKNIKQKTFLESNMDDVRYLDAHKEISFYLEAEPDK